MQLEAWSTVTMVTMDNLTAFQKQIVLAHQLFVIEELQWAACAICHKEEMELIRRGQCSDIPEWRIMSRWPYRAPRLDPLPSVDTHPPVPRTTRPREKVREV